MIFPVLATWLKASACLILKRLSWIWAWNHIACHTASLSCTNLNIWLEHTATSSWWGQPLDLVPHPLIPLEMSRTKSCSYYIIQMSLATNFWQSNVWRLIISNLNEKDSFLYSKLPTLTKSYGLNSLRNVDIDNDLFHLLINECVLFPDCYIAVWNVFNVLYKPFMWACLIDPQWESKPQWRSDKQRPPIVFIHGCIMNQM